MYSRWCESNRVYPAEQIVCGSILKRERVHCTGINKESRLAPVMSPSLHQDLFSKPLQYGNPQVKALISVIISLEGAETPRNDIRSLQQNQDRASQSATSQKACQCSASSEACTASPPSQAPLTVSNPSTGPHLSPNNITDQILQVLSGSLHPFCKLANAPSPLSSRITL